MNTCDFLFLPFLICNKFAKISNKLLSLCHYGVLFVEFFSEIIKLIHVGSKRWTERSDVNTF